MKKPRRGALAKDKVRYVGDPVACVVAETVFAAKDAAEAVEIDIDPCPRWSRPEKPRARARRFSMTTCLAMFRSIIISATPPPSSRLRGGPCHPLEPRQQPRRGQRDGAARRARSL